MANSSPNGFGNENGGLPPIQLSSPVPSPTSPFSNVQAVSAVISPTISAIVAQVTGTNITEGSDSIDPSTTENLPVQITNSFSLAACIAVLISYFIFRRKNHRLMERPSLVLAVSMATVDGLLHVGFLFTIRWM